MAATMTSENTILLNRDTRGVVTVTLNRPQRRNAFDDRLIAALLQALQQLDADPEVRVVVLTGAQSVFCAGMDLDHMRRQGTLSEAENIADATTFARCLTTLDRMRKPVIARVNGGAYGGGIGLIAAADLAIGVDAAKFALTEVRLGIVPAVIAPYVVAAIGARQARRWFLSGSIFDARVAEKIGLLHSSVPATDLDAAVEHETQSILLGGPNALGAAKSLIRTVASTSGDQSKYTANLLAKLRASAEGQEGLAAFNEKRRPNWQSS